MIMNKNFLIVAKLSNKIQTYPLTADSVEKAYSIASKLLGRDGYVIDCICMSA